jgi:kynurenine 3-monooxygenase
MSTVPDFTLIGAGPVGALMSLLLERRGHAVRLIERRADPRRLLPERGRSINLALAARGLVALEAAGLSERIAPELMPMPGRMLHESDGTLRRLRYGEAERDIIFAVSRERLGRLLIDAVAGRPGIELRFATRCLDVEMDTRDITLRDEASGHSYSDRFTVLLGTDGAASAVRTALAARGLLRAQERPLDHDYKELTVPPDAESRGGYAFEPRALHIWPRGGFMLIALPNVDASFTATLFLARHGDPGFDRLRTDDAVRRFFATHFADAAGVIPDLLQQFALHPQGRLSTIGCDRWQAAGRVLLLGDAAHAILPFHGQGLNCGFEDCRLLDRLLAGPEAREPGALAVLFERFERERLPDTTAIAAMALENYEEMRDTVRTAQFAERQALAADLARRFPGRFIPRYSMVMFHPEIPYAEAQRRGLAQERVLDALRAGGTGLDAEALLGQVGL